VLDILGGATLIRIGELRIMIHQYSIWDTSRAGKQLVVKSDATEDTFA